MRTSGSRTPRQPGWQRRNGRLLTTPVLAKANLPERCRRGLRPARQTAPGKRGMVAAAEPDASRARAPGRLSGYTADGSPAKVLIGRSADAEAKLVVPYGHPAPRLHSRTTGGAAETEPRRAGCSALHSPARQRLSWPRGIGNVALTSAPL